MKKFLWIALSTILTLAIAAMVCVSIFLNRIVQRGIETVGPQVAKVPMHVDGVQIAPLSGHGILKGFVLGNPSGYQSEFAAKIARTEISLSPRSVFSNQVIVQELHLEAPEIQMEGSLKDNNLTKILDNLRNSRSDGESKTKIHVRVLRMTQAKVHLRTVLSLGKPVVVTLPDIEVRDMGSNTKGVEPRELYDRILREIIKKMAPSVNQALEELGREATDLMKETGRDTTDHVRQGLQNLFK